MKILGFEIQEQEFNGTKFYCLVLVTDDKENPKKNIGTIKKNYVNCIHKEFVPNEKKN